MCSYNVKLSHQPSENQASGEQGAGPSEGLESPHAQLMCLTVDVTQHLGVWRGTEMLRLEPVTPPGSSVWSDSGPGQYGACGTSLHMPV